MTGGKALVSSEEVTIPVPEDGTTTTTRCSSKSQITGTSTSLTNTTRRVAISTSFGKKLFCNLKIPQVPLVWRLVNFLGSWEKLTKEQYLADSQKILKSIPLQTKTKNETKGNKIFNATEENSSEVKNLLNKFAVGQVCPTKRPITEKYIYSENEVWLQHTCNQVEGVKPIYSFPTFQNGKLTVVENSLCICAICICANQTTRTYTYVSHFLRTTHGKEHCTSFFAFALALHQSHIFSQNS